MFNLEWLWKGEKLENLRCDYVGQKLANKKTSIECIKKKICRMPLKKIQSEVNFNILKSNKIRQSANLFAFYYIIEHDLLLFLARIY